MVEDRRKEEIEEKIKDLKGQIKALEAELDHLDGKVAIEWKGVGMSWKRPYLAILHQSKKRVGDKYYHEYLPLWEKHKGEVVKATYTGKLFVGTLLQGREGASGGEDQSYFYEVKPDGLQKIDAAEALRRLGIIK